MNSRRTRLRFSPYQLPFKSRENIGLQMTDGERKSANGNDDDVSDRSSFISDAKRSRVTVWIRVRERFDWDDLENLFENDPVFDYFFWMFDDTPPTFVREMNSVVLVADDSETLKNMFGVVRNLDAKNIELSLVAKQLSADEKKRLERDLHHHLPFYWWPHDVTEGVTELLRHINSTEKWQRMKRDWNKKRVIVVISTAPHDRISREWIEAHEYSDKYHYRFFEEALSECPHKIPVILVSASPNKLKYMYGQIGDATSVSLTQLKWCSLVQKERLEEHLDGHVPFYAAVEPESFETALELTLDRFERDEKRREDALKTKKAEIEICAEREAEARIFNRATTLRARQMREDRRRDAMLRDQED